MLKHPKAKGTRLENEVVQTFKDAGIMDVVRMWGSNGEARGLPKEVDVAMNFQNGSSFWIQCKSVSKLATRFVPPLSIDATVFKENKGKKYIMLELDVFIKRFL